MKYTHFPKRHGLYDSAFERSGCGVGFVCSINGWKSHDIVEQGIKVLKRLSHRGAAGADPETGDGAGLLIQLPHEFLVKECAKVGITLPSEREYGLGAIFLPPAREERRFCEYTVEEIIRDEKQEILGWRDVPVDSSVIGKAARRTRPLIKQIFISKNAQILDNLAFERKLYIIRKRIEGAIHMSNIKHKTFFHITGLSSRTLCYKGLLMPHQLEDFYLDLKDRDLESALVIVHSRYSTNTFPTWDLAQPFRFLAHNGEINTLRGNVNWMKAREGLLRSDVFGEDVEKIKPLIVPGGSDSLSLDNVFELLVLSGRSLPHAMMMLIPSAWEKDNLMDKRLRDFYKFHACFMEPWDGPASIAFTDGIRIGAVLDRNGLRPARFIVTKSGLVVMASEVGVLDIEPRDIKISGRLEPGKMFFIDIEKQRIINDDEIKKDLSTSKPYSVWLKENMVELDEVLDSPRPKVGARSDNILGLLKAFGYTREDFKFIVDPMAETGQESIGSMGNDTAYAVLSKRPQLLYNYFKQLFAQVTNPAIDPIREELIMSLGAFIGMEQNILEESPRHCHKLYVKNPVLTNEELEKIRRIDINGFKTKTISILFEGEGGLRKSIKRICSEASSAIKEGYTFIILSDRGVNKDYIALPALLATGAVHHYLVRERGRTRIGIIVESGEAREVHHFALLFGYGADAVNPYLVYEALDDPIKEKNYKRAVSKGILKILSKMGISTLRSYKGAQIFEAVGLREDIINECFTGTVSRVGGAGFREIEKETLLRHKEAYFSPFSYKPYLATGGLYQWKKDGEFHLWNPESIALLQDAARQNNYERYKEFAQLINDQAKNPTTLRSLFRFKKRRPIRIEEVEPASAIFRRFVTGAMSFGSISRASHEALAVAMNRLGGKSNTGEGGEDPSRFQALPNGDSKRSAIKQVASGRFGVTTDYLTNADELQIKIAQGAKPGEGGQLPGHKVSFTIAATRYTTPGVTLISPPPHHDIYSIEDLAQLIFDLKNVNPRSRISVKLVSEVGVGTVAAGVAKGHADVILISGGDGGTGASPRSSIIHAGLPWELGLSETHQTLLLNNLRRRVRLQVDGQMRTGRDVMLAALLGAEEFGFCTAPLIVLGCVMLRHCHLNNCSVGIATQNELLQQRFDGRVEYVINYFNFVAQELREIMAKLGVRTIGEIIGRVDLLEVDGKILPWKAKKIDFSRILYKTRAPFVLTFSSKEREDREGLERVLDVKLIELARPALEKGAMLREEMPIENTNRSTGAMLSGEVCRRYGEKGLLDDMIHFKFRGVAGQSFGAWLAKGITFELEGMANDYIGKGASGGKIIVYPDRMADYPAEKNIIIGNTAFYGAISGEAYIRGVAGERFCIRNSGLRTVVEGVGDHGCEYMTGGRVLVLGKTGRNFAAGMSGGIAYVYDGDGGFKDGCNTSMVELESLTKDDLTTMLYLLHNHFRYTQSPVAKNILDDFDNLREKFVKVMPIEYRRALNGKGTQEKLEFIEVSDG